MERASRKVSRIHCIQAFQTISLIPLTNHQVLALDTFLPSATICNPKSIPTTAQLTRGPIWNCTSLVRPTAKALVVPHSATNWQPLYATLKPGKPIPPTPDEAERLKRFAERNSTTEVKKLADELFAQGKLLRIEETEPAFAKYGTGDSIGALEAWKLGWFAKLKRTNYHWAEFGGASTWTYTHAADDLIHSFSVAYGKSSPMATPSLHKSAKVF